MSSPFRCSVHNLAARRFDAHLICRQVVAHKRGGFPGQKPPVSRCAGRRCLLHTHGRLKVWRIDPLFKSLVARHAIGEAIQAYGQIPLVFITPYGSVVDRAPTAATVGRGCERTGAGEGCPKAFPAGVLGIGQRRKTHSLLVHSGRGGRVLGRVYREKHKGTVADEARVMTQRARPVLAVVGMELAFKGSALTLASV